MRFKEAGIAIGLLCILFAVLWWRTDAFGGTKVDVGSATISASDQAAVRQPISATSGATGGRYDSLDHPLGTDYVVTAARTFWVYGIVTSSDAAAITVTYGYGDTHVENSAAAPTNAVTLGEFYLPAGGGLERVPVTVSVPAGKYPWAQVTGPANWPSRVTMVGVER